MWPGMETAQPKLRERNTDQKNARYGAGEIRAEAREIGTRARKLEAECHGLELGRLAKGASWKRRPASTIVHRRNSRAGYRRDDGVDIGVSTSRQDARRRWRALGDAEPMMSAPVLGAEQEVMALEEQERSAMEGRGGSSDHGEVGGRGGHGEQACAGEMSRGWGRWSARPWSSWRKRSLRWRAEDGSREGERSKEGGRGSRKPARAWENTRESVRPEEEDAMGIISSVQWWG
jgi:hypothetical protein